MSLWIKNHWPGLIAILFGVFIIYFGYGCESRVRSLNHNNQLVNRQELNYELNQLLDLAKLRNADLDKQDDLRSIILNNALILVEGNQVNPVGIITAFLGLYGFTQGTKNVGQVVKKTIAKRNANNGTT